MVLLERLFPLKSVCIPSVLYTWSSKGQCVLISLNVYLAFLDNSPRTNYSVCGFNVCDYSVWITEYLITVYEIKVYASTTVVTMVNLFNEPFFRFPQPDVTREYASQDEPVDASQLRELSTRGRQLSNKPT